MELPKLTLNGTVVVSSSKVRKAVKLVLCVTGS